MKIRHFFGIIIFFSCLALLASCSKKIVAPKDWMLQLETEKKLTVLLKPTGTLDYDQFYFEATIDRKGNIQEFSLHNESDSFDSYDWNKRTKEETIYTSWDEGEGGYYFLNPTKPTIHTDKYKREKALLGKKEHEKGKKLYQNTYQPIFQKLNLTKEDVLQLMENYGRIHLQASKKEIAKNVTKKIAKAENLYVEKSRQKLIITNYENLLLQVDYQNRKPQKITIEDDDYKTSYDIKTGKTKTNVDRNHYIDGFKAFLNSIKSTEEEFLIYLESNPVFY